MVRTTFVQVAFGVAALLFFPQPSHATPFFVGEGEDGFTGDITAAITAIAPWIAAADITTHLNNTGAIVTDLTNTIAGMKAGDVLMFYYSGHGLPVTDPTDLTDPNIQTVCPANQCPVNVSADHADLQIGQGVDLQAGTGITDDTLTSILSKVPEGATAYVALDACFSGLAIANGDDLATLPIDFISTADEEHCAPGVSDFAPLFQDAFTLQNGFLEADADYDHILTEGELFEFTTQFDGPSNPQFLQQNLDSELVVVPEPATLALLGLGIVGLGVSRRKRA